mmetsp:Transcript_8689/g.14245  ORF Transcript_8689/g.14245 Transcript_8689/m.14245 type:complete len:234 (+) Transcript_8689:724-1425(+)
MIGLVRSCCFDYISKCCSRCQLPVINGDFRGRDVFDPSVVDLFQETRVADYSLLFKVSHETMACLRKESVGKQVEIEEHSLHEYHKGTFGGSWLGDFHECHEVHPLILRFLQQRFNMAIIMLKFAKGAQVIDHAGYHSRNSGHCFQHHCSMPISLLEKEICKKPKKLDHGKRHAVTYVCGLEASHKIEILIISVAYIRVRRRTRRCNVLLNFRERFCCVRSSYEGKRSVWRRL